ncbi:MAG: hypothetical protein AAF664_05875 [Planctomycetota bacterium]
MSTQSSNNDSASDVVTIDRRRSDRRSGDPQATDVGVMEQPRRKTQRRRHIDPTTCERDYDNAEIEFMRAMDEYKRASGRQFPTCSEVLEVIRKLGYVQLTDDQFDQLDLSIEESFQPEASDEESEEAEFELA